MEKIDNSVQVIMDDLDYNPKVGSFLKDKGLVKNGNDYRTIAVIGC